MYKQGDILLIPIPFSDLTSNKKRPVLVLSNDDYNSKTEDIVVAAITSNLTTKDYIVMLSSSDLDEGTLKVDSCIRVDKIYTLSQNIVISKFGTVKKYIIDAVKKRLYELI
ncbi:transcriptional modulator of MazE/toxin, MazF [Thermosinus carboxydivorans Nor1]|uniref:Transcriptional modulator of MazE/toxin, MazF n=1 Tax=Thermosinus carboxydivorans Nor1 TaxID=401526 RepID=A1HNP0_9FIRM|nr:type II toxin-antitoxin system PemK/MazF family toxin [Thermosinus carboxydivorans]EAX48483.1 transcriptional modulator of MazE/toxin, MazF [Thermosinus carboxydivorans Nor1]